MLRALIEAVRDRSTLRRAPRRRQAQGGRKARWENLEARLPLTADLALTGAFGDQVIYEGDTLDVSFGLTDTLPLVSTGVGIDPTDPALTSLGDFTATSDLFINTSNEAITFTRDTDGLLDPPTITIPALSLWAGDEAGGSIVATGTLFDKDGPSGPAVETSVFVFDTFTLGAGFELRGVGERPIAILTTGDLTIDGTVDVGAQLTGLSGQVNANDNFYIPGAGGGAGGIGGDILARQGQPALGAPAESAGAFRAGTPTFPAGYDGSGAGFGGVGGDSNIGPFDNFSPGGVSYGDLATTGIQGGSGGGAGQQGAGRLNQGGDGGGGIELGALGDVFINGTVKADAGPDVWFGRGRRGGGGAGGGILVHGDDVSLGAASLLTASGRVRPDSRGSMAGEGAGGRILVAHAGVLSNAGVDNLRADPTPVGDVALEADGVVETLQVTPQLSQDNYTYSIDLLDAFGSPLESLASGVPVANPSVNLGARTLSASIDAAQLTSTRFDEEGDYLIQVTVTDDRSPANTAVSGFGLTVGAEIVVTSTEDEPDVDLNDGTPIATNGLITLRSAVQHANTLSGPVRIVLPEGDYELGIGGTETVNDARNNDLDVHGDITIVGAGAGLSVIDASGLSPNNSSRHFQLRGVSNADLTLRGLTLTGGNTTTFPSGSGAGGAIFVESGTALTLDGVAIVDNQSAASGGGIFVVNGAADVTIERSVFEGNSAVSGAGGAVYAVGPNPIVEIADTVFANNAAPNFSNVNLGAGFSDLGNNLLDEDQGNYFDPGSVDSSFNGSVVTNVGDAIDANDGGLSLREAVQQANLNVAPDTVWLPAWNHRLTLGGVEAVNDARNNDLDVLHTLSIVGVGPGLSVIDASGLSPGNSSRHFQLRGVTDADLTLRGLTLTGGNATTLPSGSGSGGAVFVEPDTSLMLDRVAVVGNQSAGSGGGIFVVNDSADVTIERSVFEGNAAAGGAGGALYATGANPTVRIGQSVFVNNSAPNFSNVNLGANFTDLGNNLLDEDQGAYFSPASVDPTFSGFVVTSVADRVDASDAGLSLREAVIAANNNPGADEVWLPAWGHRLTRTGVELGDASFNDLDITGDVAIVGVGPGLSVVDASGFVTRDAHTRAFEVGAAGALSLEGITVTGGDTTWIGGGVLVGDGTSNNQATLTVTNSAFVSNTADVAGGGVYNHNYSTADVRRSVFTENHGEQGGGAIVSNNVFGSLAVGELTLANNTTSATGFGPNVAVLNGNATSFGNNLTDDIAGAGSLFDASKGDHVGAPGSVDLVVTSAADVIDLSDNATVLSLREAVGTIDTGVGTIWLPAWEHRLSRNGLEGSLWSDNAVDDIDVKGDVTIRGAGAGLSVIDASGLSADGVESSDRVFQVDGGASLSLRRLTLTGGNSSEVNNGVNVGAGGALWVRSGGAASLSEVAAVGNSSNHIGGVFALDSSSSLTIEDSVFTENTSNFGGVGYVHPSATLGVSGSVFASNTGNSLNDNIRGNNAAIASGGNNLADSDSADSNSASVFTNPSDRVLSPPSFVATSVADRVDANDAGLSLREAVIAANNNPGEDEVWLAPWLYVLTEENEDANDEDFALTGDLDVREDLVLRSAGDATVDATLITDAAFETIGATLDSDLIVVN